MLKELSEYKGHTKDYLWAKYVRERLDDSYNSYIGELESSGGYLGRRNELNLTRKMNTYDKQTRK